MTNAATYLQLRAAAYDAAAERRRVARQLREAIDGVSSDLAAAAAALVPETWESKVASIRAEEIAAFEVALGRIDDDVTELIAELEAHAARLEHAGDVYNTHYWRVWGEEQQKRALSRGAAPPGAA